MKLCYRISRRGPRKAWTPLRLWLPKAEMNVILHRRPLHNCGCSLFYGPRQFHREIGVCIVLVDIARDIAEQTHVKAIGWPHVTYKNSLLRNSLPSSARNHTGQRRESSSWNMNRNAEAMERPLFIFTGTRCRYCENTWTNDTMYLYI